MLKESNDDDEEEIEVPSEPDCPQCKGGFLTEIIIVGRSIKSCPKCQWRDKAKKL